MTGADAAALALYQAPVQDAAALAAYQAPDAAAMAAYQAQVQAHQAAQMMYMQQAQLQQMQQMQMQALYGGSLGAALATPGVFGPYHQEALLKFKAQYNLDDRIMGELGECLNKRLETFDLDLQQLYAVLTTARHPPGLLSVKIREMRQGIFGGMTAGRATELCGDFLKGRCQRGDSCKFSHEGTPMQPLLQTPMQPLLQASMLGPVASLADGEVPSPAEMSAQIMQLVQRYNFDDRIHTRLAEAMHKRAASFQSDMRTLVEVLATARNPAGLLSVKLQEMEDGSFVPRGQNDAMRQGEVCGDFRRGICTRGDRCRFAHPTPTGPLTVPSVSVFAGLPTLATASAPSQPGGGFTGGGFSDAAAGFSGGPGGGDTSSKRRERSRSRSRPRRR